MINPFGIVTGVSSLIDDTVDWFDGDDAARPSPPPPPVDYRSLFDEEPVVDTVAGAGPGGVQKMVRQSSLVDDASDPRFPALQQAWREGKPVEDLLGNEPFRLKARIAGNGGDNWRPDVAKVQVLLNKAGYHVLSPEEGPNGYHSTALDRDIRSFQRANKLAVDGKLSPDGETIRTLERTLSPKPKTVQQEDMPKPADKQSLSGARVAGDELSTVPSTERPDKPLPVKPASGRKQFKPPDWKSEAIFDELVEPVFKHEGGYSNNKFDRGGETNYGITSRTLEDYQLAYGKFGPNDTLIGPKALTKDQAREIYRNEFFYGQRLHEIDNPGIVAAMLDSNVIHSPKRAWKLMQRSLNAIDELNSITVDGIGGFKTINKINSLSTDDIIRVIEENDRIRRESIANYIAADPNQKQFDRGWSNRFDKVKKNALATAVRHLSR